MSKGKDQIVDLSNARVRYPDHVTEGVERKRWALGKEAAEKGQPVHGDASEEFRKGHITGKGFGLNVMPKRFGAGNEERVDWVCGGCGTENRRYLVQCSMCGVHRSYTQVLEESDAE